MSNYMKAVVSVSARHCVCMIYLLVTCISCNQIIVFLPAMSYTFEKQYPSTYILGVLHVLISVFNFDNNLGGLKKLSIFVILKFT